MFFPLCFPSPFCLLFIWTIAVWYFPSTGYSVTLYLSIIILSCLVVIHSSTLQYKYLGFSQSQYFSGFHLVHTLVPLVCQVVPLVLRSRCLTTLPQHAGLTPLLACSFSDRITINSVTVWQATAASCHVWIKRSKWFGEEDLWYLSFWRHDFSDSVPSLLSSDGETCSQKAVLLAWQ